MARSENAFEPRKESVLARDTGVLRNAASDASASAAGNLVRTVGHGSPSGWPQAIPDFDAPNDVRPKLLDRRPVSLETDADVASGISLVFSYNPNAGGEQFGLEPATVREFAAFLEWGTGNGRHVLELDIAEGTRVTLHTQTVNVLILDYSLRPSPETPYWRLENAASSSYLPGAKPAVKTQRAYRPNLFGTGGSRVALPPAEMAVRLARASAAGTVPGLFVTEVFPASLPVGEEAVALRVFGGRFAGITDLRLAGEDFELPVESSRILSPRELELVVRPDRVGAFALEVDAVVATRSGPVPQTVRVDGLFSVALEALPLLRRGGRE